MSDYSKWGKAYYEAHKADILAAEKDKKRWLDYYQKNKEAIAERNRRRYYERRGLPVPEKAPKVAKPQTKPPTPDPALMDRFEKLVDELRVLAPQVVKPKRTAKAKKAKASAAPPALPASPGLDGELPGALPELLVVDADSSLAESPANTLVWPGEGHPVKFDAPAAV